jgi:hypothetical protein
MTFMGDLEMLTREQLQGVLISIAKPQFLITRDERYATGYCVRLSITIGTNRDLLTAIIRTLLQYEIVAKPYSNGKSLKVNGNDNLCKLLELIPKTLPAKANWMRFSQALEIVKDSKHQTQEGLDELFRIKGLL